MMENILLVQEAIHFIKEGRKKGMVIKIDMETVLHRVRHNFLFPFLAKFGFGADFFPWISSFISNPWISPLINGRAATFLQASRVLRQGRSLSPLLYAIQASVLSLQLEQARPNQELLGIQMARGAKDINHVQFADDTILLRGASQIIARRFKNESDRYCQASGSKINLRKS